MIAEIDWSVGQILEALKREKLDGDTLVMFASDNGPWLSYGNHGGSQGPFREGKGTAFEGGVRVPFVARWPGHIPKGAQTSEPAMTIDLLPTVARLAGAAVPQDRSVDGRDIWPLLGTSAVAASPHDVLYFYWGQELHAVRSGRWKLHLPHPYQSLEAAGADGAPGKYMHKEIELSLFNLVANPGETTNVAAANPTGGRGPDAFRGEGPRGSRRHAGQANGEERPAGGKAKTLTTPQPPTSKHSQFQVVGFHDLLRFKALEIGSWECLGSWKLEVGIAVIPSGTPTLTGLRKWRTPRPAPPGLPRAPPTPRRARCPSSATRRS